MDKKILNKAIQKWGQQLQMVVAMEELAELQKALSKCLRGGIGNVEEEIADVKIMIAQLELMFNKDEIDEWERLKLERLEQRINAK